MSTWLLFVAYPVALRMQADNAIRGTDSVAACRTRDGSGSAGRTPPDPIGLAGRAARDVGANATSQDG
jgi:hypothetical protein